MKHLSLFFRTFLNLGMPLCIFGSSAFAASATSEEALASAKESMTLARLAAESACDETSDLEELKINAENATNHAVTARDYADEASILYSSELVDSGTAKKAPEESSVPDFTPLEVEYDSAKKAPEDSSAASSILPSDLPFSIAP